MTEEPRLSLRFHGRVLDHLGLEMYQSPVAAIAELVSNAWDADAESVEIELPEALDDDVAIVVRDDGVGMTLEECQQRFLNVGYNRRGENPLSTSPSGRPLLGRKGIGKFAGFGIARTIEIETVSSSTGERTLFAMDLDKLRGKPDEYVGTSDHEVDLLEYEAPDEERRTTHGTTLRLRHLSVSRRPSPAQFGRSMGRRFILLHRAEGFTVTVNGDQVSADADAADAEFSFPAGYTPEELPEDCTVVDGWGVETLPSGETVRWRVDFYPDPIPDGELVGISVFAHGKLAQRPFLFNLTGGLGGQNGIPYLSGRVEADFVDESAFDLISTERQRVNWERAETQPLLDWGQGRVKSLLRLWQKRRSEEKTRRLLERLDPYTARLERLPKRERQVVERALKSVARIDTLSSRQYEEFAVALLTAWEAGRLRDLINDLARLDDLGEGQLISLLMEAKVLTALHTAEKVRSQVELVEGLRRRVEAKQVENAVRDYIAENPWLLGPDWETYSKERAVDHLVQEAADESGLSKDDDWNGRVDLVLAAGDNLLIVEFMRPGLAVDWDHVERFNRYVSILREKVDAAAGGRFQRVRGLLVADRLETKTGMRDRIRALRSDDMDVSDWGGLLSKAESQWREYLELLRDRAPDDERLISMIDDPPPIADDDEPEAHGTT